MHQKKFSTSSQTLRIQQEKTKRLMNEGISADNIIVVVEASMTANFAQAEATLNLLLESEVTFSAEQLERIVDCFDVSPTVHWNSLAACSFAEVFAVVFYLKYKGVMSEETCDKFLKLFPHILDEIRGAVASESTETDDTSTGSDSV